ncbi:MAG: acyltransferase family protein [Geminicoccaceae bacterium]
MLRHQRLDRRIVADTTRVHSLDGLRAVSIALVMAAHFTKLTFFPAGFGVTIFFVISGFLITHLLLKEIDRTSTIDLPAFYKRRVFRLLPAILVSLVGVSLLQSYVDRDWIDLPRALASIFFLQNYNLNLEPFHGPLSQHWSLAIEEHFYLLFPALLLWLVTTRRPVVRVLLGLCLLSLVIRTAYATLLPFDDLYVKDLIYRSTEARMDSLLYGCILAVLAHRDLVRRHAGLIMLFTGLALMLVAKAFVDIQLFRDTLKFTFQSLGVALAMAAILYARPGYIINLARWVLNCPPMVFLGRISFSTYLTHTAMFHAVRVFLGEDPSRWILMPAATAATILVSWLSYRFVEQPMINLGKRVSFRRWQLLPEG